MIATEIKWSIWVQDLIQTHKLAISKLVSLTVQVKQ